MTRPILLKITMFLSGAAMITLGIIILSRRELLIRPLVNFAAAALLIHGAGSLAGALAHSERLGQERKKTKLITAAVDIFIALFIAALPGMTFSAAVYLLALYLSFNGISKLVSFIIAKAGHQPGHYIDAAAFIFYAAFAVLLTVNRNRYTAFLMISGIYCVLFGAEIISDLLRSAVPEKLMKNDLRRHIRISLPVFISTFLPIETLRYINEYFSLNDRLPEHNDDPGEGRDPDIEIMVHVSDDGSGRIGHLDLYFDGEVISYGNHDRTSQRLFGAFGSGVVFFADKEPYLRFSVEHDRQTVFSYGLRLTPEQIVAVRGEIEKIKKQTVPWRPPYQEAVEEKGAENVDISGSADYASAVWNGTHARFYRFTQGIFRIYSILGTNCVMLTDSILGKAGIDMICITGVSSPGIYYDYLERLYRTDRTMVITKTIYDNKTIRCISRKEEKQ